MPIEIKPDGTLVLMGTDGQPHIEVRPHYETGTGPTLLLYRVNSIVPEYLATIAVPVIEEFVQKLPTAIEAAKVLHDEALKAIQAARNGVTEPK